MNEISKLSKTTRHWAYNYSILKRSDPELYKWVSENNNKWKEVQAKTKDMLAATMDN